MSDYLYNSLTDPSSERYLLAAIAADNSYLDECHKLRGDHFCQAWAGSLFEAIKQRIREGKQADLTWVQTVWPDTIMDTPEELAYARPPKEGSKYVKSLAEIISDKAAKRAVYNAMEDAWEGFKDPIADVKKIVGPLVDAINDVALEDVSRSVDMENGVSEALAIVENSDGSIPGVATGLVGLDNMIGGLQKGHLYILAGRPSMGKTALALRLAVGASVSGGVGFFSLEMPSQQLLFRMLSSIAYARHGDLAPTSSEMLFGPERLKISMAQLRDCGRVLQRLPIEIQDRSGMTISQIEAQTRKWLRKWEQNGVTPSCIVVDYLTLMKPETGDGNIVVDTARNVQALKDMAKTFGLPVVVLSQLNRGVEAREDKRPNLGDLRWAGEIEQAADVVMFVYREEYYLERQSKGWEPLEVEVERHDRIAHAKNKLEIIVDKNRTGPIGSVVTKCAIGHNYITNWDPDG